MKGTLKRVMSGVLSVITIASAVAQPMTAYAAEPEKAASSFEAQYPELEVVKDKLAEDEILTANDYSIDLLLSMVELKKRLFPMSLLLKMRQQP